MITLDTQVLELQTRHAFHIARAEAPPVRRNVRVRLTDADGVHGLGEAAATPYYGETADTVLAALPHYLAVLRQQWDGRGLPPLERIERALLAALGGNPSARAALSSALHDLTGRKLSQPVWRLLGLDAVAPQSSFTLGIDAPDAMRAKVEQAAGYPILKLKLGTEHDAELLRVVRDAAPRARIRVDANTGWSLKRAIELLPLLHEVGVELIEQPFPAGDVAAFRSLRERAAVPIIADESCLVAGDVPGLAGAVDGVNIKLTKTGSLREAIRLAHTARAHGMLVMLGCMIESTLGIAAAVQLAPLVDCVDLDGAALLAHDPFRGPGINADASVRFNDEPGLGVIEATTNASPS